MGRQGNVLLFRVEDIPKDAKPIPREDGRIVLDHKKATGYTHAILDEGAELMYSAEMNQRFLRVMNASGVQLVHGKHGTITLEPGAYRVILQREYTFNDMFERLVAD